MPRSSLEEVEFTVNPEPRCPCILLLDTSMSMEGEKIESLNQGLQTFKENLAQDKLASMRVEVAIVTFDSTIQVIQDFITVDQFVPPRLTAQGSTAMGSGIETALDILHQRKQQYRNNGIAYYRPWIFLITDGEPTDSVENSSLQIEEEEKQKRVVFFAVGVEGANIERLKQLVVRHPLTLRGLDFREMFVWLSTSMQRISNSQIGAQVSLPPTSGWGSV